MAQKIQDVMTTTPITIAGDRPIREAATVMKERSIGDVMVMADGQLCGVLTDRDIVVRVIAEGRDPQQTPVSDVSSGEVICVTPDDDVRRAVELIRKKAIRRVPVVDDSGGPVGFVSMGDLAVERDERSALADVSAAAPNA